MNRNYVFVQKGVNIFKLCPISVGVFLCVDTGVSLIDYACVRLGMGLWGNRVLEFHEFVQHVCLAECF